MEKEISRPQDHALHPLRVLLLRQKAELLLALALNRERSAGTEPGDAGLRDDFPVASVAIRVDRVLSGKLSRIEEALQRMDSGNFGICVQCGVAIARDRLQAVLWERYCTACRENRSLRFTEPFEDSTVMLEPATKSA